MKRAQERIAQRVLELLPQTKGKRMLDIGCGTGYTAAAYQEAGYKVVGLDLMQNMVEKAKERGFDAHQGNMKNLSEIFEGERFDVVTSVSALQWIKNQEELKQVAREIYAVTVPNSPVVIQFYPRSEEELKQVAKVFRKNGFDTEIITDNPENPRKRTVYLVMKKE